MRKQVTKPRYSLAIRIPQQLAEELHIYKVEKKLGPFLELFLQQC
ncbi:hypothetical protein DES38_104249 [Streptohalobacillus salinus]|uniref:Uncharacterized protein n=1 Tax=Streptohalobacillus salinus TaxID=621096 RepID=A0A2V3WF84_9BACI|nr:hypothetical protein DES38_104249 [Streptohalobacillus salinus]